MRGVVYVDILFLVNAVIGLFLLRCTARLAGRECRAWRMALGGMMAGTASLALLLPPFPAVLVWGLKAAEACLIVVVCGAERVAFRCGVCGAVLWGGWRH